MSQWTSYCYIQGLHASLCYNQLSLLISCQPVHVNTAAAGKKIFTPRKRDMKEWKRKSRAAKFLMRLHSPSLFGINFLLLLSLTPTGPSLKIWHLIYSRDLKYKSRETEYKTGHEGNYTEDSCGVLVFSFVRSSTVRWRHKEGFLWVIFFSSTHIAGAAKAVRYVWHIYTRKSLAQTASKGL